MNIGKKKKVLFLIGMEQNRETLISKLNRENSIFLQCYQPVISHPFDDLMRDILIAVYQENVEQVVVVASKKDQMMKREDLSLILENKGLQEKIQTLDYLFKNTMSEFPSGTIKEWLGGEEPFKDRVKNTVHLIKHHPLMPLNVEVKEIWLDHKKGTRLETDAG